jgi:hypothetical protein
VVFRNPLSGTVLTVGDLGKSMLRVSSIYITPQEEKALVEYLLQACRNGSVKAGRALAYVIARQRRQRSSPGQGDDVRPPNQN